MASVSQEGVGLNVRYAPLAVTRLVAAVFFPSLRREANRSERVSRLRSTERSEAWP